MELNNRVASAGSKINQASVPKQASHSVGHLSNYGRTAPVRELSVNQVIKGEVTDLRNNEVTVVLDDNTAITGHLENGSQLSIGDTVAFRVTDINARKVYLQVLPKSAAVVENSTISKALEEAGLPKNDKNQTVVRELINANMPINKQSIQMILRQSYQFKNASISTLVIMNKNQIPLTEANVTQFESYRNMEHQMIENVNQLTDELPLLLGKLSQSGQDDAVSAFTNRLFSTVLAGPQEDSNAASTQNPAFTQLSSQERSELAGILDSFASDSFPFGESREAFLNGTISFTDAIHLIEQGKQEAASFDTANSLQFAAEKEAEAAAAGIELEAETLAGELAALPKAADVFDSPLFSRLYSVFDDLKAQNGQIGAYLSSEETQNLFAQMKDFPLEPAVKEQLLNGTITGQKLLTAIKNAIPFTNSSEVSQLLSSEAFRHIFQNELVNSWTLTPEKLKQEDSVQDFYTSMHKQAGELEQLLAGARSHSENGAPLSGQAQNMRQSIDFMQTLNQMFGYMQLPLKLPHQKAHGELYVYTKKKDLKKNNSDISVLLHLDMEHLGPLDIHLSLHQRQVTSRFYFEDKGSGRLLSSSISQLTQALEEKGYTITSEFLPREKDVDIVKDFIEKDMPPSGAKRYTFDMRA